MAKVSLNRITASRGSKSLFNTNSTLLETAIDNTLSLDGSSPNAMLSDFDMNSNDILNAGTVTADGLVIDGVDLTGQADLAAASAAAALVSETNAATSETNAATSEANAAASAEEVIDATLIWQGAWDSGTTYAVNDAVSEDGASYICTLASTNNTPPNVTYWDLLAARGGTGAGTGDMLAASNLSDVASAATSRANLVISAANTPNVAAGNIVATDVQAAINELDTEKEPVDADIVKSDVTANMSVGYTTDVEALGTVATITADLQTEWLKSATIEENLTVNESTDGEEGACLINLTIDANGPYTITLGAGVLPIPSTGLEDLEASSSYEMKLVKHADAQMTVEIARFV